MSKEEGTTDTAATRSSEPVRETREGPIHSGKREAESPPISVDKGLIETELVLVSRSSWLRSLTLTVLASVVLTTLLLFLYVVFVLPFSAQGSVETRGYI